jgi:hypothetical protein
LVQFHLPEQGGAALISVRFAAHYGLKSDIALSPKSATNGSRRPILRSTIAPFRNVATYHSRHTLVVLFSLHAARQA